MSLTIKETEHLAKLARLELTDVEKRKFSEDISAILQYVNKLQELKVDDGLLKKSTSGLEKSRSFRDDRVVGVESREQKDLIKQAPESEQNLIKTRPVFW